MPILSIQYVTVFFSPCTFNSKMSQPRCVYTNNRCRYQSITQQYLKRCLIKDDSNYMFRPIVAIIRFSSESMFVVLYRVGMGMSRWWDLSICDVCYMLVLKGAGWGLFKYPPTLSPLTIPYNNKHHRRWDLTIVTYPYQPYKALPPYFRMKTWWWPQWTETCSYYHPLLNIFFKYHCVIDWYLHLLFVRSSCWFYNQKRITLCGMYKFQSSISCKIKHSLHRIITRFSTKQHQCHQVIFAGTYPFYNYTVKPHSWATVSVYKQDVLHHSSLYAVNVSCIGEISHCCLQRASLSNNLFKNWSNNSQCKMTSKSSYKISRHLYLYLYVTLKIITLCVLLEQFLDK